MLFGAGGWLTYAGLGPWYERLDFPPYQPPGWVFTPAWGVVLALLAVATWRVAQVPGRHAAAFVLYGVQCILNVGWSLLFFTLQRPDVALWELAVLDAALLLMIAVYARASRTAALMLIPYLAWLLFATAINGWIVQFNGPFEGNADVGVATAEHSKYMQHAISVAGQNPDVPFGAVLVDRETGEIVARGVNQSSKNPTLHGEIAAINQYAESGGGHWSRLTLYTTAEPCCMCQGAILWSGISEVVYATSIAELHRIGWRQIDIPAGEVSRRSWNPEISIVGGIRADECDTLFRDAWNRRS
jgi:tRNA(Arg) A34 adenosine deaminase TadA/tryptophan-rich sensory protein